MTPNSQMKRILKYYSVVLILVITVFAISISSLKIVDTIRDAKSVAGLSTLQVKNYFVANESKLTSIEADLTKSRSNLDHMSKYFSLDTKDYLSKVLSNLDDEMLGDDIVFLPSYVHTKIFLGNEDIKEFGISLDQFKEKYYATEEIKLGSRVDKFPETNSMIRMYRNISDPGTSDNIGSVFIGLEENDLKEVTKGVIKDFDMNVYAISDTGNILYNFQRGDKGETGDLIEKDVKLQSKIAIPNISKDYYYSESTTNHGVQVVSLISKKSVLYQSFRLLARFILASILIEIILISALFFLFKRYEEQVGQILMGVKNIGEDGLGKRIPEENQKAELKEITVGINQMLDRLDQYVEDIYRLDLKQKDAHMMALQSQINPHFLYNTLEYIRMYAVSIGADELSEVVYSFASLLRNNISQDKESTIQNELLFCEKYVYLYQMRYPNKIAYDFKIDDQLDELILPKFSLQPLIENYFVHGIDYTRKDNAIRVIASQEGQIVTILIEDNGSGMLEQKMLEINRKMGKRDNDLGDSIGLANVNARLASYFGDSYYMNIKETVGGGVTIKLSFEITKEGVTHA